MGDGSRYCPDCGERLERRRIEGQKRPYCPDCGEVRYRHPATGADVTVVDGPRVLVVRRGAPPNVGSWAQPGGYLEFDEAPPVGASRELEEETGLRVDPGRLTLVEAQNYTQDGTGRQVLTLGYATRVGDATGRAVAGSDATEVQWVTSEELTSLPLAFPYTLERAERALERLGTADVERDVERDAERG